MIAKTEHTNYYCYVGKNVYKTLICLNHALIYGEPEIDGRNTIQRMSRDLRPQLRMCTPEAPNIIWTTLLLLEMVTQATLTPVWFPEPARLSLLFRRVCTSSFQQAVRFKRLPSAISATWVK